MPSKIEISLLVKKFDRQLDTIIHEDLPILKDIKKKVIESGGKRIRPLTHYFLTSMLDYKGKQWLDVGSIAELIHAASLLHDDVIDNADVRRGKPTIGKLYGNKTAILSGDYLLACGIDHLNKLNNPALMSSFTRVIRDLAVGELVQMQWEKDNDITIKIYNDVIYGKTASLFGAVSETAGILALSDRYTLKKLHTFGINMGMLFQMKDDYIDYFEESEKSGKIPMKDFLNGLYTYPLILLKLKANKKEKKEIKDILSLPERNEAHCRRILELIADYHIREEIIHNLKMTALSLIEFLKEFPDGEYQKMMIGRIEDLVES